MTASMVNNVYFKVYKQIKKPPHTCVFGGMISLWTRELFAGRNAEGFRGNFSRSFDIEYSTGFPTTFYSDVEVSVLSYFPGMYSHTFAMTSFI